jgi:hypothetical protein
MDDPFSRPSLLAIGSDADADLPAVVWIRADSPFTDEAGVPYPNQLVDGTGDVHGPWVVTFLSAAALALIGSDELLRGLLLEGGSVREFAVGRLIEYALAEDARIILNPFLASGCKFSLDELREVREENAK